MNASDGVEPRRRPARVARDDERVRVGLGRAGWSKIVGTVRMPNGSSIAWYVVTSHSPLSANAADWLAEERDRALVVDVRPADAALRPACAIHSSARIALSSSIAIRVPPSSMIGGPPSCE